MADCFMQVGQALSLRPDLLPQPYLEALSELQVRSNCSLFYAYNQLLVCGLCVQQVALGSDLVPA